MTETPPKVIWAVPPIGGTFADGLFMASAEEAGQHRYHHDAVVQELRDALAALVLNIDAGGATLGAMNDARIALAKLG